MSDIVLLDLVFRSRDRSERAVRIAGSLPPLEISCRPGMLLDDEKSSQDYREMVERLAPASDVREAGPG